MKIYFIQAEIGQYGACGSSGNILVETIAGNDLEFLPSLCLSDGFPYECFFSTARA